MHPLHWPKLNPTGQKPLIDFTPFGLRLLDSTTRLSNMTSNSDSVRLREAWQLYTYTLLIFAYTKPLAD